MPVVKRDWKNMLSSFSIGLDRAGIAERPESRTVDSPLSVALLDHSIDLVENPHHPHEFALARAQGSINCIWLEFVRVHWAHLFLVHLGRHLVRLLDPLRGDGRFIPDRRPFGRLLCVDVVELLDDLVDIVGWAVMSIWILFSFGIF